MLTRQSVSQRKSSTKISNYRNRKDINDKFYQRFFFSFSFDRDEVLTKNKFLEEEAKRKAEAVDNSDEVHPVSSEDSQQEDDIFYDSQVEEREK